MLSKLPLLERLQKPKFTLAGPSQLSESGHVIDLAEDPEEKTVSLEELRLETLRSEVNLLIFPFFALNNREVRRKRETVFRTVVVRNNAKVELSWSVSANTKYGYPGPFDKEVHRTIEEIINEMELPIKNPIRFSTYALSSASGDRAMKILISRAQEEFKKDRGDILIESSFRVINTLFVHSHIILLWTICISPLIL